MAAQQRITQAQLCAAMKESGIPFTDIPGQLGVLQAFVLGLLEVEEPDKDWLAELEVRLRTFLSHAIKRYQKSSRKFELFMSSSIN